MHSPVGPATLEHEPLVDRAVQRAAPVGVGPLREPGKQVRDEAVAIARELDDRLEHVLVSDPPKGHAKITVATAQAARGRAALIHRQWALDVGVQELADEFVLRVEELVCRAALDDLALPEDRQELCDPPRGRESWLITR